MGVVIRKRKIATRPRNPWQLSRLVKELALVGKYGLKNKKELWTHATRAEHDKKQARTLLISINEKEVLTQGRALLNRLYKNGLIAGVDFNDIEDIRKNLREVLKFTLDQYLDRRLQTVVFNLGLASDVHQARIMINGGEIKIRGRTVDKPSMTVRVENEGHIELNPFGRAVGHKKARRYAKYEEVEAE